MNIHRARFVDYTPSTVSRISFSHGSTTESSVENLRMAVGRTNGDIEIWNPKYGWICEQILKGGRGRAIEGLKWSLWEGEVKRLFSIGASTVVTEWDLETGEPLKNYDCNSGVIWDLAVNKSNTKIAVGCDNGAISIIDISGGKGVLEHDAILQKQNSRILSVDFNGENQLVAGCADGRIRVWDIDEDSSTKGRIIGTMKVDKSHVNESTLVWCVKALDKQHQIVSGDSSGCVKIWDSKFFTLQHSFDCHKADVLCLDTDLSQEKIYSGGVDRKIFNFSLLPSASGNGKPQWVNNCSKLTHTNDIRTLSTYESKTFNVIVSGGADKQIVVNYAKLFSSNIHKTIPLVSQVKGNIIVNKNSKSVVLWHDHLVKIWKLIGKQFLLVAKLSLSEEENIQHVAVSLDGGILCVSYLESLKTFVLEQHGKKLHVKKTKQLDFGAKFVQFASNGNIIAVNFDNSIMKYDFEQEAEENSLDVIAESEAPVKEVRISSDNKWLAISKLNGSIDVLNLKTLETAELALFSAPVVALEFLGNDTITIMTAANEFLQYNIEDASLTEWSKKNSKLIFNETVSTCCGMFNMGNRVWLWGESWLAFVDTAVDIVSGGKSVKRRANGTVTSEEEQSNEVKFDQADSQGILYKSEQGEPGFWLTPRYKWLIFAGSFDNELVVIERPLSQLPSSKAFKTNLIKF